MSIERYRGDVCLSCDDCGDATEWEDDFLDLIDGAKGEGWAIVRDDAGEWTHYCPDCRRAFRP